MMTGRENAGPAYGDHLRHSFDVLNAFGSLWTVLIMLVICLDVVGRTTLSRPIDGVAEFSALSIVCTVFLQLPAAIAGRRLTRADALLVMLTKHVTGAGRAVEMLWALLGLSVFAAIAYSAALPCLGAYERNEFIGVEGMFTFPSWIVWLTIVVGAVLSGIAFFLRLTAYVPSAEADLEGVINHV